MADQLFIGLILIMQMAYESRKRLETRKKILLEKSISVLKNINQFKINTALLSFGMSGKVFHAPFIDHHPGFELIGVLERTKNESRLIYPGIHIYRTLEEVIDDPNIELVIINTPTQTHFDFAKKALLAGKHVVVEKAFTTTVEEAKFLMELAKELGLVISVYQNRRWDSDFSTVCKIVNEGTLGNIHSAAFHFDRYKEQLSIKLHKETPGPGAGLLLDLGPHLIDQAIYLFGMPQSVLADIRTIRPGSMVDDDFTLFLYYPSMRVTLKSSLLVKEPIPSFIVHGSKGSFIKQRADIQEAALINGDIPYTKDWGKELAAENGYLHTVLEGKTMKEFIPTLQGNYGAFYNGLYNTIREGAPCLVDAKDGLNVMKIIEAAQLSNAEQKAITITD